MDKKEMELWLNAAPTLINIFLKHGHDIVLMNKGLQAIDYKTLPKNYRVFLKKEHLFKFKNGFIGSGFATVDKKHDVFYFPASFGIGMVKWDASQDEINDSNYPTHYMPIPEFLKDREAIIKESEE